MVYAAEPGHIENISFDRVSIHIVRPESFPGGQQDLRPNAKEALPDDGDRADSCFARRRGSPSGTASVTWGPNPPGYFKYALDAAACPGLDAAGLSGTAAHPGMAAKLIR